jgi:hypothetical protein
MPEETKQNSSTTPLSKTELPKVDVPAPQSEKMTDIANNPYKKWIYLAAAIDSWRIWPRAFLTVYVILVYKVVTWFMSLPTPNLEQSGLVSVVVGAGAAWFGLYLGSSPRK